MAKTNGAAHEVAEQQNEMVARLRKVFRAGLGAVSMTQDSLDRSVSRTQERLSHLFGELVERGEGVEADGRKMVSQAFDRRRKQVRQVTDQAESGLDQRIEEVVSRLNLPTRADVKALTTKVNSLSRKLDELNREQKAG